MINWYSRQVLLSYTEHAELGWRCNKSEVLERKYTWIPISLSEMAEASAHFPIVIMRYQKRWLMVVVPGVISLPNIKIKNSNSLN